MTEQRADTPEPPIIMVRVPECSSLNCGGAGVNAIRLRLIQARRRSKKHIEVYVADDMGIGELLFCDKCREQIGDPRRIFDTDERWKKIRHDMKRAGYARPDRARSEWTWENRA